jgi:probable rRNA maturation factor
MYQIELQTEVEAATIPTERLTTAIGYVLDAHDVSRDSAITVVIVADEYVRDLNKQFRGVDAPTDVLSFPADAPPPRPGWMDADEGEAPYLGDLIIAYPYTSRQAAELSHTLDDELTLLVIHGTLHLLGYDHDTPEHQDEMWAAQSEALAHAHVPIEVPRFSFADSDTDVRDSAQS